MSEVVRVEKSSNYTVMSNAHLRDDRLSLKAIGLLSKILSLPEDWDYTIAGLTHICCEGKAAVATAIRELEAAGYIERRQLRTPDGSFGGNEYVVHEAPIDANSPLTDFRLAGNRLTENPSTDNPSAGNRPQLNTDIPSTDIYYPPTKAKTGNEKAAGLEAGALRRILGGVSQRRVKAGSNCSMGQTQARRRASCRHGKSAQTAAPKRGMAAQYRYPVCIHMDKQAPLGGRAPCAVTAPSRQRRMGT